ncbi:MAG: DNA topoisomerase 3 [Ruminococcus sp.]
MQLIIAEKPSVGREIAAVLGANTKKDSSYMEGNGYIVSWCFGHLVGLSMPSDYCDAWKGWSFETLPMIPEEWKFNVTDSCKAQYNILKKLMNNSSVDEIICATDADREGECIFRYVYNLSGCRKPVKRLWISSLEESAIKDGFSNLKNGGAYDNLYYAGFARAKADWIVGMNGSRLFSVRYGSKLSIGRVQTPTLAMIVKRDYEVKNFVKQKYFTVDLNCGTFTASSERIDDAAAAQRIAAACNGKTATIIEAKRENKKTNPPKLYDLTTLQRDANKLLGYTAQQTLDYMQSLYEAKLVTYPRTDSQYLSDDMEESTMNVVNALFHADTFKPIAPDVPFAPDIKRSVNNKKVTGHHAIIPTMNSVTADLEALPSGERNILLLVVSRLICAAAAPHEYIAMSVKVSCEGTVFSANGKQITEMGWKSLDNKARAIFKSISKSKDEEEQNEEKSLPELAEGQTFENVTAKQAEHWTSPPKLYTEATLLTAMEHAGQDEYDDETEKKGLGTPATRAGIIEGLVTRGYAERKGKQITATEKGVHLIKILPNDIKSPKLTADWEMKLQQMEHGQYSHEAFMQEISDYVRNICSTYSTETCKDSALSAKVGKCPVCGKDVLETAKAYSCEGGKDCNFKIWKNICGKSLSAVQAKNLLSEKKRTDLIKGMKGKSGKLFDAYLYMKPDYTIGFEFPKQKK